MAQPIPKVPPPPPSRVTGTAQKPPPPRAAGAAPRPAAGKPPSDPAPTRPSSVSHQAGDVIAQKYRLVSLLGEGGMGSVWRARNMDLEVEVALKLIRSDAALTDATDRLLREAQSAAKLIDPSIVRVFDFGRSEQGNPFIVMELLEGEDLAAAIQKRGRLSSKRAVRVLLPVVRALSVAHQNGIVHRDLKPENVFLAKTSNGLQPKVVDFGIAQLDKSQALRLTSTGALMGSPLYMSPEQAKGEAVDLRADIWGISAVLYEALTGKQPFPGGNYNAVLCAIMLKEPERPADELGVDEELWSLVQRGLAKEPAFRYESMRVFGQELAKWLVECGEQTDITGASLITQWLADDRPSDQLTTVFPPTAEVRIESVERNAPTQRLSRDPGVAAVASQRSQKRSRRRMLMIGGLAGGLIGALTVAWLAFGTGAAESPAGVEPAQATAPAKEAPQIRASEPAEPPQQPAADPAPSEVAEPRAAEAAPDAAEAAPDAEAAPEASTAAKPATAQRAPRRQPATSRPTSGKRTSKLKNPFAP